MRSALGLVITLVVGLAVGCGGSGNASIKPGKMPENGSFSGVYFSPQYGEMHLVQNGNAVVGKFKKDERSGKIQGEADGDVLSFEWTELKAMVSNRPQETRGHGYFRYVVDASNGDHVLKGRWGLAESDTDGGEWNAYKSRTREPDPDSLDGEKTSGGESSDDSMEESGSDDSSDSADESEGEDEGDDVF